MMTKELPIYYTSRTPTTLYQKCNRARYINYHHLGTGVEKDSIYLPFLVGGAVHKGLEVLLGAFVGADNQVLDISDPKYTEIVAKACEAAREEFRARVGGSSFDLSGIVQAEKKVTAEASSTAASSFAHIPDMFGAVDPVSEYVLYLSREQEALVEVLVSAYAFSEQGMKELLRTYEILEVEQEDSFELGRTDEWILRWESRADGLLRRRVDDALVVLSFKTASRHDTRTTVAGESDMQGMSEVMAVEKRLKGWWNTLQMHADADEECNDEVRARTARDIESIPDWFVHRFDAHGGTVDYAVEAVQMIYLIKGATTKDDSGFTKQDNALLRPWVKRGQFGEGDDWRWTARWEATGPRGGKKWETLGGAFSRVNLWEEAERLGCSVWEIIQVFAQTKDDATGACPLDRYIVMPNVHRRERDVLERWERQTRLQEMRIAEGLHKMHPRGEIEKESEAILDEIFPLTGSGDGKCAYWSGGGFNPSKCPNYSICWEARFYWEDPLGSGYKRRKPNHPGEAGSNGVS